MSVLPHPLLIVDLDIAREVDVPPVAADLGRPGDGPLEDWRNPPHLPRGMVYGHDPAGRRRGRGAVSGDVQDGVHGKGIVAGTPRRIGEAHAAGAGNAMVRDRRWAVAGHDSAAAIIAVIGVEDVQRPVVEGDVQVRLIRAEPDGIVPPRAGLSAAAATAAAPRPGAGEARLPPDRRFRQMAEGEPPPAIPTSIRLHRCCCSRYQGEGQHRSDDTEKEHRARAGTAHPGQWRRGVE